MAEIVGKYTMEKSENFDEFMKALGIGMITRKMAGALTPTVAISLEDGVYTLLTSTTFKSTEIKFKIGQEFEETTGDGRVVKSTLTLNGNTLTHSSIGDKEKKEKDSILIRVFGENGFDMECKCDDVVSKRSYKRME